MKKYRICCRYSPSAGTWYVIQKRTLFGWHTLNISFNELYMANSYIDDMTDNEICETPLEWDEKKQEFYVKYPCKTSLIRVK